jgi:hypothetical protein
MKKGPNYLVHNTTPTQSLTKQSCIVLTVHHPPTAMDACIMFLTHFGTSQSPHPLLSEPRATALKVLLLLPSQLAILTASFPAVIAYREVKEISIML